jgi:hypothetical protein
MMSLERIDNRSIWIIYGLDFPNLSNSQTGGKLFPMARELVWLENRAFVAWGCGACDWIISDPALSSSDIPSREVKEAFNQHQCEEYPRKPTRRKPTE